MRPRTALHPYQRDAIDWCDTVDGGLILADVGLGKTVMASTMLADRVADFATNHALIVAPNLVAKASWTGEFAQWQHLAHITPWVLSASWKDNVYRVMSGVRQVELKPADRTTEPLPAVTICPTHYFAKLVDTFWGTDFWRWDLIVIDEVSKFKSTNTNLFRAARRVHQHIPVFGLTATPTPQSLGDLWSQVYLIDSGEALGRTKTAFQAKFMTRGYHKYAKWKMREGAQEAMMEAIRPITYRIAAEDHFDVDHPRIVDRWLTLDAPEMAKYTTLQRDAVLELEGEEITAVNAAALTNKLRQLASGSVYTSEKTFEGRRPFEPLHTVKLDALDDIFESLQGRPVLVGYEFQADAWRIMARFAERGAVMLDTRNTDTIDAWNRGEIPMLIAHPKSCSHGLNLQHGGETLVFYTPPWPLDDYEQMIGRLARQGQERPVTVFRLLADDTIDVEVQARLASKGEVQRSVLDIAKRLQSQL